MSDINRVLLVGRLGKDPDCKKTPSGTSVARMPIATTDKWKDKNGDKKEITDWHRVVAWDKLADIAAKYFSKGNLVLVEGKIKTRSWEQDGVTKYITEIIASNLSNLSPNTKPFRFSEGIGSDSEDVPF